MKVHEKPNPLTIIMKIISKYYALCNPKNILPYQISEENTWIKQQDAILTDKEQRRGLENTTKKKQRR